MANLGIVSGTIHQVTDHVDATWPSSGHCMESALSVHMPTLTETDLAYTSFLIGGGFWVEAIANGVPTGQQVPVQVSANCPGPGSPGDWWADVVLYADDVAELLSTSSYTQFRLHVFGYFVVQPVYPAV